MPDTSAGRTATSTLQTSGWLIGSRYRVRSRLGNGAVADVFAATDQHLGRDVAVKVFRAGVDPIASSERRDIELQALARLSHPNLVTLFDASVGATGGGPDYLVMELVHGASLAEALQDGPLESEQVREIGVQIASALAYVHESGIVHRDVKPANILLGTDPSLPETRLRARLSDFGIARIVGGAELTREGLTLGTAAYLAPEQVRGSAVGPEADIYSLGLVLLEALTGQRAYDGPTMEAALARLARGPRIPGDLPHPWPALLAAMTAPDPGARPTAAAVARSLGTRRAPEVASAAPAAAGAAAPAAIAAVPVAGAIAAAATTELPAAGAVPAAFAGAAGEGSPPPAIPPLYARRTADPPRPRRRGALLAAALAVLAAVGIVVLIATTASSGTKAPSGPGNPALTGTSGGRHNAPKQSAGSTGPVVPVRQPRSTPAGTQPKGQTSKPTTPVLTVTVPVPVPPTGTSPAAPPTSSSTPPPATSSTAAPAPGASSTTTGPVASPSTTAAPAA